jgi:hypothetical protein
MTLATMRTTVFLILELYFEYDMNYVLDMVVVTDVLCGDYGQLGIQPMIHRTKHLSIPNFLKPTLRPLPFASRHSLAPAQLMPHHLF